MIHEHSDAAVPETRGPLVSVVMPAYNAARTLPATLASLAAQTMPDFEVLVGDDASRDSTADIVNQSGDARFHLFRNESNLGPGRTRDALIARARGQWIAFMDADDEMAPERLEVLLAECRRHPAAMVFDDVMRSHDTRNGLVPWRRLRGRDAFGGTSTATEVSMGAFASQNRLLIKPLVPTAGILASGVRHPDNRFGEDNQFFLRLAARGMPLVYVPRAMYFYRITPGSLSTNPSGYRIMRDNIQAVLDEPQLTAEERRSINCKLESIDRSLSFEEFEAALRSGRILLCLKQLRRKPWIALRFVDRGIGRLRYHAHRLLHRGRPRHDA